MRPRLRVLLAAALLPALAPAARAQGSYPPGTAFPMSRDTIVGRIADLQRIHTPEGIERLEPLDVNGSTLHGSSRDDENSFETRWRWVATAAATFGS